MGQANLFEDNKNNEIEKKEKTNIERETKKRGRPRKNFNIVDKKKLKEKKFLGIF